MLLVYFNPLYCIYCNHSSLILQILIEFCAGGAVDAVMLGESVFLHPTSKECDKQRSDKSLVTMVTH
jgi:hypothetical protein